MKKAILLLLATPFYLAAMDADPLAITKVNPEKVSQSDDDFVVTETSDPNESVILWHEPDSQKDADSNITITGLDDLKPSSITEIGSEHNGRLVIVKFPGKVKVRRVAKRLIKKNPKIRRIAAGHHHTKSYLRRVIQEERNQRGLRLPVVDPGLSFVGHPVNK